MIFHCKHLSQTKTDAAKALSTDNIDFSKYWLKKVNLDPINFQENSSSKDIEPAQMPISLKRLKKQYVHTKENCSAIKNEIMSFAENGGNWKSSR